MKYITIMIGMLLAVILSISGCAPFIASKEAKDMTPEQIKAYNEQGLDVYQCLNISGPPPNGGYTLILVPKKAKIDLAFASNCNPLKASVVP